MTPIQPDPTLGDQELEILRFVLEHGPISVRDLTDRFGTEANLARTTLHTVLERLRKKGFLTRRLKEGVYLYEGVLERKTLSRSLINDFVRTRLGGSLSPFVSYLAETKSLKPEEITELRNLLNRLEEKEGKE